MLKRKCMILGTMVALSLQLVACTPSTTSPPPADLARTTPESSVVTEEPIPSPVNDGEGKDRVVLAFGTDYDYTLQNFNHEENGFFITYPSLEIFASPALTPILEEAIFNDLVAFGNDHNPEGTIFHAYFRNITVFPNMVSLLYSYTVEGATLPYPTEAYFSLNYSLDTGARLIGSDFIAGDVVAQSIISGEMNVEVMDLVATLDPPLDYAIDEELLFLQYDYLMEMDADTLGTRILQAGFSTDTQDTIAYTDDFVYLTETADWILLNVPHALGTTLTVVIE